MATINNGKVEFKGGEVLPTIGSNEYAQAQSGVLPTSGQTINSSSLDNSSTALVLPSAPVYTYGGLPGATESLATTNKSQAELNLEAMKKTTDSSMQAYLEELIGSGNISSSVDRSEQDAAKKQADLYTSQLEQEQLANRRAIEKLQKENSEGLGGGALGQEVNRLNRESLSKQADIAILQTTANRNYDTAASIADREVAMKLEQSQANLGALKFFYENNKADFDKADERLYAEIVKKADAELKKQTDTEEAIKNLKLNVAQYAGSSAASILSKLSAIDTTSPGAFDEAVKVAGRYASDPLDRAIKQAQLNKINFEMSDGTDTSAAPSIVNPETGKYDPSGQLSYIISKSRAKDNIALQAINGVVAATQQFADRNTGGEFAGVGFVRPRDIFLGAKGTANQSGIEAINLKVQQWASGAALTEAQTKQVAKITPRVTDTDKQIRNKTNALMNFMLSQAKGTLASQGISYNPEVLDLFTPQVGISTEELDILNETYNNYNQNLGASFYYSN